MEFIDPFDNLLPIISIIFFFIFQLRQSVWWKPVGHFLTMNSELPACDVFPHDPLSSVNSE